MWHNPRSTAAVLVLAAAIVDPSSGQDVAPGRTLVVNDIQMYYEEAGKGPPLVLLHYFGGCTQIWQPHREFLAQHFRLIIPDLPGHGRSSNPVGPFTHRQAARDVYALLDSLRIERFQAVGTSSGGMTLIHMATQQPERIASMVLVGATSYFPEQARSIMQRSAPDSLRAQDLARWGRCSSRGDVQTRQIISQFYQMKDSYDDMTFTEPYLATITAQTLIIHGDRDEFFPVAIPVQMYRAIPRASLWIVPDGGHLPIFGEFETAFQNGVSRFLGIDQEPR